MAIRADEAATAWSRSFTASFALAMRKLPSHPNANSEKDAPVYMRALSVCRFNTVSENSTGCFWLLGKPK